MRIIKLIGSPSPATVDAILTTSCLSEPRDLEGIALDADRFFLMSFITIFSILTVMRLYFRTVTGDIRTGFFNMREGAWPIITRSAFGTVLFVAVGLYIVYPERISWAYLNLPVALRVTGIVIGFCALYGIFLVHRELGKYFSISLVIRKGHKLVKTGPYRFVRHPMYTSYLLLFIAAFLITENWLLGSSGMAVIATLMTLRIGKEEAMLLEHFGQSYADYRQTTGMFLPMTHKLSFRKKEKEERIIT